MAAVLNVIGGILLIGGWLVAYVAGRGHGPGPAAPPAGWFPDPAGGIGERLWDGHAWTPSVRAAPDTPPVTTGRFHRRFWRGGWAWIALGAVAVLALGSLLFYGTGAVHVMALASFLAMTGLCWAFYRFVASRLALGDVIGVPSLISVATATAGGVILLASNANAAIINGAGIRTGLLTVGLVEEGTKLLVPLSLLALGRYRDPRAGIAIGLMSGFGFAVIEATEYAYASASGSGPSLCGGGPLPQPTVQTVIQTQVYRIFLVEPLHWLWTGFAVAVAWRMWWMYGRRATAGAVGAILLVVVAHSLNDSSAGLGCDDVSVAFWTQVFRWALIIAMYLLFRAAARKSTPPQLIGLVGRGWLPHHLRTYTRTRAFVEE